MTDKLTLYRSHVTAMFVPGERIRAIMKSMARI